MIGSILSKRYKLEERIGGGGTAVVYKGTDELLHRTVAVKILNPAHLDDEESVRSFRREAQAAARLSHFNIVNVYDRGEEGDIYYIVMEYIEGKTLKEIIRKQGALPVSAALEIAIQICDALEHAHQKGVVHRDIKPHNILLTDEGQVKVADFGIARAVTSGTVTRGREIFGSVHYFSPEQARGSATSHQSDIYSLGVVIYEMVTGKVPYSGESAIAVAVKHIQEEPSSPRRHDPSIPVELERIILKAMQREPSLRYADAASLRSDLGSVLRRAMKKDSVKAIIYGDKGHSRVETNHVTEQTRKGEGEQKVVKKSHKKKIIWSIIVLLAIALIAYAISWVYYYLTDYLEVPEVTVPDVLGLHQREATDLIEAQQLRVRIIADEHHTTIPANHVIRQDPSGGQRVKEEREVNLTISKGPLIILVPNVIGLPERNAEIELLNEGLQIGEKEYVEHETVAEGVVIEQNPNPNISVEANTRVDLVISIGPPIVYVPVPSLIGRSLQQAEELLENAGLQLGEVDKIEGQGWPDEVLGQYPEAGVTVEERTAVDVTVVVVVYDPADDVPDTGGTDPPVEPGS